MTLVLNYPTDIFTYRYLAGPVLTTKEIDAGFHEGNCRFALQLYFYRMHNHFLERDQIYLPGGYKILGTFIFKEEPIFFDTLKTGDVIYAQNLRNKNNQLVHNGRESYKTYDEWLYHLHSAIYIGKVYPESDMRYVWHATSIEGGPALWPLEKFEYHYIPVSAKRVL